jgi:hypothetical protein
MKTKVGSLNKSKHLILCMLVLIIFLSSCATIAPNIKSTNELKEDKLLVGRFVFYENDKLIKIREKVTEVGIKKGVTGFSILFKKGDEKPKKFELDENGYAYIPVGEGEYYITRIRTDYHVFLGSRVWNIHPDTGITVHSSDSVVNFGTIKVELQFSTSSKVASALIMAVIIVDPIIRAQLRITQTSDWDTPRQYILSRFGNISSLSIRDEIVKFPEEAESPFK